MSSYDRRNSYSQEFKVKAVEMVFKDSKRVIDVATELGISPKTLSRWKCQLYPETRNQHRQKYYENQAILMQIADLFRKATRKMK